MAAAASGGRNASRVVPSAGRPNSSVHWNRNPAPGIAAVAATSSTAVTTSTPATTSAGGRRRTTRAAASSTANPNTAKPATNQPRS